jgi:hypothetical protein
MIIRGEPDVSTSLEPFRERLVETVAWCARRADAPDPRDSLRDPALAPRALEPDYFAAVSTVVHNRRSALPHPFRPWVGKEGRLMVYYPDAELSDGAAELESGGFFDVCNCPPWGTWVGMFRDNRPRDHSYANYLVAWVPRVLEDLVARGIEVNPERCILWLDESDCGLQRLLEPSAAGPSGATPGLLERLFRRG